MPADVIPEIESFPQPIKLSAKNKKPKPNSKITFIPTIPPNFSLDLTSKQFYSHILCEIPATQMSTSTCSSARMDSSVTHHSLAYHMPAT